LKAESLPPKSLESGRPPTVRILSFERDLDSFRLALLHPYRFKYLQHPAPFSIGREGRWVSPCGRIEWVLLEGDFRERMQEAAPPALVFYDPFSSKVDSPLWRTEVFARVLKRASLAGCELFTYSNSTLMRARLLAAGWFVAKGVATGPKAETTIAACPSVFTSRGTPTREWLDSRWLERWNRSGARTPENALELDPPLKLHPQFTSAPSVATLS
jgi:queuine tRNA-ribosyltransferase